MRMPSRTAKRSSGSVGSRVQSHREALTQTGKISTLWSRASRTICARRGKPHDLDAESRFDGLDLVAKEPRQAFHVAHRRRGADADRFNPNVDTMKQ